MARRKPRALATSVLHFPSEMCGDACILQDLSWPLMLAALTLEIKHLQKQQARPFYLRARKCQRFKQPSVGAEAMIIAYETGLGYRESIFCIGSMD